MAEVKDIDFSGNDIISDGDLKKAIKTQEDPWYYFFLFWKDSKIFNEEVFLNDLLRIEFFMHQEGFLDARVKDYEINYIDDDQAVKLKIILEEGQPTQIDSVIFKPVESDSLPIAREKLLDILKLKKGERYRQDYLREDYNKINDKFSNSGYPYIKAQVKPDIDRKKNTVILTWFINPGPASEFGKITITGNKSVSENLIRRGIDFKEGQPFSQKKLTAAQSQIYGLEVFQYVNLQASDLDKRPTQIPIQVQVKERDLRSLSIGLGYGTEESFRVKADWTNRNFLGGIRILRANLKHSTKLLPIDAQIELSQPFFFDDQNDFLLRTFYTWQDEESYEARRIGVGTAFNRQLSGRNNVFITTRTERDSVRAKGNITNQNTNNLYNKSVLTTGFKHNSTNNLFTPSKGSIARIMIEESGLLFNSKFKYFKSSIEYRSYRELTGNVVFAFRLFLGSMKPYAGRVTTPIEERFYAGGSYSVRGWGRQQLGPSVRDSTSGKRVPVGGNSDLEGNLEIRYPIYKNLGGSVFLDFGNVWSNWNGIDVTTLKYALGTGLNYNTPIGPVRVDFAWKLNKQYANESNYQIHISIGQAF